FTKSAIPPRFVLKLCEFVGWVVTPHELRPDLYPSKLDGITRLECGTERPWRRCS
ncbi:helix-turn-helix domain-containing protein, partial [Klebsiella pneumoniae]|nr:helix-turn-helix domain-containing protein [Klebsiella pneumoniae]